MAYLPISVDMGQSCCQQHHSGTVSGACACASHKLLRLSGPRGLRLKSQVKSYLLLTAWRAQVLGLVHVTCSMCALQHTVCCVGHAVVIEKRQVAV